MTWPRRLPVGNWASKLKPPLPKVITFDAYDTLYSTTLPVMEHYCMVGNRHGIQADPMQLTQNFPQAFKELKSNHPNYGKSSKISARDWWCLLVQRVFQPLNPPEEMVNEILTRFEGLGAYEVLPDVKSFLQEAKSRHPDIVIGIISNTDPILYKLLKNIGLYEFFQDNIYLSYELEVKKPSAEVFQMALADIVDKNPGLKQVSNLTSRCWHIGDEEVNDMLAASSAGWNGILLDRVNKYGYLLESFGNVERTEHGLSIDKIDSNSSEKYHKSVSQSDIVQTNERNFVASNFDSLKEMLL